MNYIYAASGAIIATTTSADLQSALVHTQLLFN
jgi:hypothetical protein